MVLLIYRWLSKKRKDRAPCAKDMSARLDIGLGASPAIAIAIAAAIS